MSQGRAATGSLKSHRKSALETVSGVLLPSVPLVASPMGVPRVLKQIMCLTEGHRHAPRRARPSCFSFTN